MKRAKVIILLLFLSLLTLACGGSSNRQLQSINIKATSNAGGVQFTASGIFSAPPTSVTPLPVDWANGFLAPPPENVDYTLSTQPYILSCLGLPSGTEVQVTAFAPQSPGSPIAGSLPSAELVMAHSAIACP